MDLKPLLEKVIPNVGAQAAVVLVTWLLEDEARFVPGICEVSSTRLMRSRWAYCAVDILADLRMAGDLTFDDYSGLVAAWPLIGVAGMPPRHAIGIARRLAGVQATFVGEVVRRIQERLPSTTRRLFSAEFKAAGGKRSTPLNPQQPPPDPLKQEMADLKRLEQSLRADFGDRTTDLGAKPSQAERTLVVRMLGLGYTLADIALALRGQAASAERKPIWKGENTAEAFVRLTWILSDVQRLQRALSERPRAEAEPRSTLVEGDNGTRYVGGMEIFEGARPAVGPVAPRVYGDDLRAGFAQLGVELPARSIEVTGDPEVLASLGFEVVDP